MDNEKQSQLAYDLFTAHPAHLLLGSPLALSSQLTVALQKWWCRTSGCGNCAICRGVKERQFHGLLWLSTDKPYKREQLDDIFNTIQYQRDPGDHYFFVIEQAELLTVSCANSLLKSLEEPPAGYHFILLAENSHAVLPTVRSRCIVQRVQTEADGKNNHPLFDYFTDPNKPVSAILSTIDQLKIGEQESIELIEAIKLFWSERYKKEISSKKDTAAITHLMLDQLDQALRHPPMPGSSKLFWKNVVLSFHAAAIADSRS